MDKKEFIQTLRELWDLYDPNTPFGMWMYVITQRIDYHNLFDERDFLAAIHKYYKEISP